MKDLTEDDYVRPLLLMREVAQAMDVLLLPQEEQDLVRDWMTQATTIMLKVIHHAVRSRTQATPETPALANSSTPSE